MSTDLLAAELACSTEAVRAHVAGLEFALDRALGLRAAAVESAGDAITEREQANRERDAAARELAAVLAERDAPRADVTIYTERGEVVAVGRSLEGMDDASAGHYYLVLALPYETGVKRSAPTSACPLGMVAVEVTQ